MTKILIVGDVHLSDRPPSSCTDSYLTDLFDLLGQVAGLSRDYDAVVQAGDLFHYKIPGRTSHRTMQATIEWVGDCACPVYVVPGNHDMTNDRFESVMDSQPLGVVLRAGARLLRGWDPSGLPLYGVPWLSTWNDRDPETGGPSALALGDVAEATEAWRRAPLDGHRLLVTHAPFYAPGFELPYEFFPTAAFAAALGRTGQVYYGHVHEAHGIYESGGVTFANHGALSRGSIAEYDVKREIAVTSWDSGTGEFTKIPLAYRPAEEVYRMADVTEARTAQLSLDIFLASIGEASIQITSVEAVMAHVRELGLDPSVEKIIQDLLVEVR